MSHIYDLNYKPRRPQGLTPVGYRGDRLLKIINHPITSKIKPDEMPPKTHTRSNPTNRAPIKSEADVSADNYINARPESSEEEEDVDIKPTLFKKRPEVGNSDIKGGKLGAGDNKAKKARANGNGTWDTRNKNTGTSPSSSSGSNSTKRKSESQIQQDKFKLSSSMVDPYGRIIQKKKAKTTYQSSQSRQASSQSALASKTAVALPPGSSTSTLSEQLLTYS